MSKRAWTVALTLTLTACGNSTTPTTPSTTPSSTTAFALSGQVYDVIVRHTLPLPDSVERRGIPGATVSVADGPNREKLTTTDGLGFYSLTGLQQATSSPPEGNLKIVVSAANYVSKTKTLPPDSSQTLDVFLSHPDTVSTFHVKGIATDDDGAAVPGATVTIRLYGGPIPYRSFAAVTDSRGSYRIDFEATHVGPALAFAEVNADSPGYKHFCDGLFPASYDEKSQNMSEDLYLYRIKNLPTTCDQ
jgi:hypothetical protein